MKKSIKRKNSNLKINAEIHIINHYFTKITGTLETFRAFSATLPILE